MRQELLGFWDAAASAGPYANNLHSLQTDNHSNTSSLNFYRPDALPDAQPTENERVPTQLAQCRFPGLAIFNGTLLWNFVHNSRNEKNFATPSRSYCQHSCSTVELVDHTYDGRRVVAGRTQFVTRRSTVALLLRYYTQGCSGAGTRWNAVPANILEPERRSGKYRWPQVEGTLTLKRSGKSCTSYSLG